MTRGSQENPITARKAGSACITRMSVLLLGLIALEWAASPCSGQIAAPKDANGASELMIAEVKIEGNSSITDEKIRAKIASRAGRPINKLTVDNDMKNLLATKWFTDVNTQVDRLPAGGCILKFIVREMPILTSVEFIGRKNIRLKEIEEATDLKKGARADAIRAQLAKRQILQLYKDKGYEQADVQLLEGGKPGDTKVVISIFEGPKFEVGKRDIVGNTFVSDAVLLTKISSRPPLFMGMGGRYAKEGFEEDAQKLREYYQNNGFLACQVRPVVRTGPDNMGRQDVTFVIEEGERFKVRNVIFEGNKKIETKDLKPGLKLHSGQFYNDSVRTADRLALQTKYFGIGCIDAAINVEPRYTEKPDVLDLVYKIEEGDIYKLGELIVRGNARTMDKVVRREADMSGLLPGELLDLNRIDKFKSRLSNTGYFNADPRGGGKPLEIRVINRRPSDKPYGETQIDLNEVLTRMQNPDDEPPPIPDGPIIEAPAIRQGPGQLVPFGSGSGMFSPPPDTLPAITVPTAPRTAPDVPVRGRPDGRPPRSLPLGTGEPPGTLPSLPFTNRDDVGPDRQEPFANRNPSAYADVMADVDEAATGRLMFGLGASSFGGLNANLILQENNFDLFAVPRSFEDITNGRAFRGAGQQFRLELSPGTLINRYIVSFSDPYLFDLPIGLNTSGYQFTRFYTDWSERRGGGRFSLGRQFGPSVYADVAFRIEDVVINGFKYPAPAELLAVSGHTTLATLRPSVRWDTRNNPFTPSSGSYLEAAFEQGWGSFTFPKFTVEGRKHWETGSRPDGSGKRILTMRSYFGVTGRDTPIYEKFFAGDFRSMRGFYYRGVGPHIQNVNVGGVFTSIGSVEYQFPWTANDQFHQVIFCDFGTVESDYSITNFRAAVGTGIRVLIPQLFKQMPLAFDLAFPIAKAEGDRTRYFTFFIGAFW